MKLLYKDGITVQALSPAEEAHYKHLGYQPVKEPEPVADKAPKKESKETEKEPPKP